jgi:hypothetical protein
MAVLLGNLRQENERLRWRHPNILPEWMDLPGELRSALRRLAETYVDDWNAGDFALNFYHDIREALMADLPMVETAPGRDGERVG